VDDAIDGMLEADIIKPSLGSWAFPLVLVDKKDGTKRFCVDFRKLNQISKVSAWPLPHIDDILATLGEARVFTSLDLRSGYFQIPLDEDAKEKCTFTSHRGLFSFNVLPFGLTSAPSLFTALMPQVLDGINGKFAATLS